MKLEIRHVSKKIRKAEVLKDVDLEMHSGRIYGFRGPNGCGKTMLMRAVCGLIRPDEGAVILDGEELHKDLSFPRSVGLLLENPAFLRNETGKNNLLLLASVRKHAGEKEVRDALKRVGLAPEDRRKYYKYSLGMKQRLGIAAAILEKPDLVLLDEPLNALDQDGIALIRRVILEERDRGALILLACHDQNEMDRLADTVFTMAEGKITGRADLPKEKGAEI